MASSLIGGLIADGYDPQTLNVSEPDQAKRDALAERFGVCTFADSLDALRGADTAVLCVKPQMAHRVCRDIAPAIGPEGPLLISIMAGVTEASIQAWLGQAAAVVRTMPNTPAMIQSGAIAMHASDEVDTEQRNRAETIMRACGLARWVAEEALVDVATAVSGSGPAYFFRLMEAMEACGDRAWPRTRGCPPADHPDRAWGGAHGDGERRPAPDLARAGHLPGRHDGTRPVGHSTRAASSPWWSVPWGPLGGAPPKSQRSWRRSHERLSGQSPGLPDPCPAWVLCGHRRPALSPAMGPGGLLQPHVAIHRARDDPGPASAAALRSRLCRVGPLRPGPGLAGQGGGVGGRRPHCRAGQSPVAPCSGPSRPS